MPYPVSIEGGLQPISGPIGPIWETRSGDRPAAWELPARPAGGMIEDGGPPRPAMDRGVGMGRITLAGALGVVGTFAVGFGALRVGTPEGERWVFAWALAFHATTLLGAFLRRGRSPEWVGASLLGWIAFLAVTTDFFVGPAGTTFLPSSDLAEAAFDLYVPELAVPTVDGLRLDSEPDKFTASDRAMKAYEVYKARVDARAQRRTRAGTISDLLAGVLAALAGAALGRVLAPGAAPSPGGPVGPVAGDPTSLPSP